MKSLLKKTASRAVDNDHIWRLLDATLLKAARFIEWERQKNRPTRRQSEMRAAAQKHFPDSTVRRGPFRGLKFCTFQASTGYIFPKLSGTYECELHAIIEKFCNSCYSDVINIGCGEGYYAVGMAMRLPNVKVFAYDAHPNSVLQCQQMAELNNVGGRVVTGGPANQNTLTSHCFTGRTLVICDCEGYEKELFTEAAVSALAGHDLLIEVHDFIDVEISALLRARFEKSHDIEVIPSMDEVKKVQKFRFDELAEYDWATRRRLLAERQANMEWFCFTSRSD